MSLRYVLPFAVSMLAACGGGGGGTDNDLAQKQEPGDMAQSAQLPTLTIHNTLSWCTVMVTVGTGTATSFSDAAQTEMAASGTTITLSATPNPGFQAVKWTGTTTNSGADATYVMTSAAAQSITACCPEANGSGC